MVDHVQGKYSSWKSCSQQKPAENYSSVLHYKNNMKINLAVI